MSLMTDKQTLNDLNIFGERGKDCVYAIFNRAHTRGSAALLMARQLPKTDESIATPCSVKAKILGACFNRGLITVCDKFLVSSLVRENMSDTSPKIEDGEGAVPANDIRRARQARSLHVRYRIGVVFLCSPISLEGSSAWHWHGAFMPANYRRPH